MREKLEETQLELIEVKSRLTQLSNAQAAPQPSIAAALVEKSTPPPPITIDTDMLSEKIITTFPWDRLKEELKSVFPTSTEVPSKILVKSDKETQTKAPAVSNLPSFGNEYSTSFQ